MAIYSITAGGLTGIDDAFFCQGKVASLPKTFTIVPKAPSLVYKVPENKPLPKSSMGPKESPNPKYSNLNSETRVTIITDNALVVCLAHYLESTRYILGPTQSV